MTTDDRYSLHLPADLLSIRDVSTWLAESLRGLLGRPPGPELVSILELALQELLVNVVEHAYGGAGGTIDLTVELIGDDLEFTVTDSGREFESAKVKDPDPSNPSVRGYGLTILRRLTTTMIYRREDGHNHWTLTFPAAAPVRPADANAGARS